MAKSGTPAQTSEPAAEEELAFFDELDELLLEEEEDELELEEELLEEDDEEEELDDELLLEEEELVPEEDEPVSPLEEELASPLEEETSELPCVSEEPVSEESPPEEPASDEPSAEEPASEERVSELPQGCDQGRSAEEKGISAEESDASELSAGPIEEVDSPQASRPATASPAAGMRRSLAFIVRSLLFRFRQIIRKEDFPRYTGSAHPCPGPS